MGRVSSLRADISEGVQRGQKLQYILRTRTPGSVMFQRGWTGRGRGYTPKYEHTAVRFWALLYICALKLNRQSVPCLDERQCDKRVQRMIEGHRRSDRAHHSESARRDAQLKGGGL